MPSPQLILIEFNELCPSLLREFMDAGHLPNFRRFHDASAVFTTDAGETYPNLEPWIQWPTVHSGMACGEHRVFHLGDGRGLGKKCIAQVLSDAGLPVGVFGSMNTNYGALGGYFVPDPWDKQGTPYPDDLGPYYRFVARQVQESSRDASLPKSEVVAFLAFLLRNGLSAETVLHILRQLATELRDRSVQWRRAVLLDRIQYDVFRALNRRYDVRFATFFSNSTAHFQHYYWRNMAPAAFVEPPPASAHPSLAAAILYGYMAMDRLLGYFLRDYSSALLVLCTALSQQPWKETRKVTFRPHDFGALFHFAGVSAEKLAVNPVMAEQFHVDCGDESEAGKLELALLDLQSDGQPLMYVERTGKSVFAGCRITDIRAVSGNVRRGRDGAEQAFGKLFYMIHGQRSGRHHPDGALWIRTRRHRVESTKVPLTRIAPTLLAHFQVAKPDHMREEPLPL